FVGMECEMARPHGLTHPILMDALVPQLDGFRFFYILPFSDTRLLIEDTYYSSTKELDEAFVKTEIQTYMARKQWLVKDILRVEKGVLPIPLQMPKPKAGDSLSIGLRGGLFHATTGYSLPWAVDVAETIASQ